MELNNSQLQIISDYLQKHFDLRLFTLDDISVILGLISGGATDYNILVNSFFKFFKETGNTWAMSIGKDLEAVGPVLGQNAIDYLVSIYDIEKAG